MFRRGSLTSPAVNVMLFQASAENSEPVCDTQNGYEEAECAQGGEAGDDLDDSAACPQVPEVIGHRRAVPTYEQASQDQA